MDSKPRIAYLFTILIAFAQLLSFTTFADSAFSAVQEKSLYVIHVSSFKHQEAAEAEVSNFLQQGLQAFYRDEVVEGKGNWFRVFIGTFNNRKEATAKGVELMKTGIISYAAPREVEPDFIPGIKTEKVEIEAEVPAPPPVVEEERSQTEVPQKPAAKPTEKTVQEPLQVEVPQQQVEKPIEKTIQETPAPEKKIEMERGETVDNGPKREPSSEKLNFSLALNGGAYIAGNTEDFEITEQTPSAIRTYFFTGGAYQISLEPNLRAYKDLNVYGRLEYVFADDVNILFLSFGPKLRFNLSELKFNLSDRIFPFIKGGFVWGDFSFDSVPGKFDNGFGYEGGFGFDVFLKSPYKIGFDLLYRSIEFDYIHPGTEGVTATDRSMDASGFSMSGTFTYVF